MTDQPTISPERAEDIAGFAMHLTDQLMYAIQSDENTLNWYDTILCAAMAITAVGELARLKTKDADAAKIEEAIDRLIAKGRATRVEAFVVKSQEEFDAMTEAMNNPAARH